jgi:hypothetical protein
MFATTAHRFGIHRVHVSKDDMSTVQELLTSGVGTDVETLCSKCGDVAHVVLDHKDGIVDRCQCKECGRKHKYKPTDPVILQAVKDHRKAHKKPSTRKKTTRKKASEPALPPVVIDESLPMLPYKMSSSYAVADQIEHKKFGQGVVIEVIGPNKMQVNFLELGAKTLLQGRT